MSRYDVERARKMSGAGEPWIIRLLFKIDDWWSFQANIRSVDRWIKEACESGEYSIKFRLIDIYLEHERALDLLEHYASLGYDIGMYDSTKEIDTFPIRRYPVTFYTISWEIID